MDVEDHRHCKVCGRICGVKAETCSQACQDKRDAAQRSRRTWTSLLYILAVVFAFLLLIELLH